MLTVQNTEAIRRIEEAIGYTFHDKRLLVQVLTRKTYLKIDPEAPDNEVLEFYGDTLMNYHVTNYFMSKYAHMLDDGLFFMRTVEQFTDMRSHYVCNRYLTDRVKALGLSRYLRAQNRDAELRRDGEKAYADIFESLVGAIYLDSYQDDNLIRAFILRQLGIEPKRAPADIEAFDYDSLRELPLIDETASVKVSPAEITPAEADNIETAEVTAAETVASSLSAESEAPATVAEPVEAAAALEIPAAPETASEPASEPATPEPPVATAAAKETETAAEIPAPAEITTIRDKLAEFCTRLGYELPTYGETPKNAPNARPVAACTLKYKDAKGKQVKISLNDSGKTLAEATEKAAAKMLKKLEKQIIDAARAEAAKIEPVAEAPVAETPVAEAPIAEAPVAEAPVAEAPVAEAPVTEAPVTEAPAEEKPVKKAAKKAAKTKAPAKKTTPKSPKTVEAVAEAEAETVVDTVVETAAETVAETAAETAVETAAEEAKPTKKAPAKRKAPAQKKDEAREAAEVTPTTQTAAAEPSADAAPPKAKRSSTGKRASSKSASKNASKDTAEDTKTE